MAKKKVAAKKSTNKKNPVKKVKSVKPAKKAAKKATSKVAKASPKKMAPKKAKKTVKAAPVKKAVKAKPAKAAKAAKAPVKKAKAPAKKAAASPKVAKASATPVFSKPAAPAKKLDLSNFVTPLDDRLIVQVSGSERMTAGGLYIPDTVADVSGNLEGMVVAVGRGHFSKKGHLHPMDVQVGDKVVFAEFAGSKIKIQNEDLIILREGEVMGVVSK